MKKVAFLLGFMLLLGSASALAAPTRVTFSGRLTTATGPVNGAVNLTFKLFDTATGGTEVWSETRNGIGADDGLVYVELGETTTLDQSVFNGGRMFLEITVDTEVLAPRLAINSVPYAISSTSADAAATLGGSIGPGDVVTTVSGMNGVAATKTGNTLNVSLATTGCSSGQVYKYDGATWACQADADTTYTGGSGITVSGTTVSLATTGCASGEVWKFNGTTFTCEPDTNTVYTAGIGISIMGTTVSLATNGCASGEVWKYNGTTFTCDADKDTVYAAGVGITVAGNTISLSTSGCATGEVWKYNGTTFTCQPDVNTTYSAGSGIMINGSTVALNTSGCAANEVLVWTGSTWSCTPAPGTFTSCTWQRATTTTSTAFLPVTCPSGRFAISGGCDPFGTFTVAFTRPFGPPADGEVITGTNAWYCQFSGAATNHNAYALCCDVN